MSISKTIGRTIQVLAFALNLETFRREEINMSLRRLVMLNGSGLLASLSAFTKPDGTSAKVTAAELRDHMLDGMSDDAMAVIGDTKRWSEPHAKWHNAFVERSGIFAEPVRKPGEKAKAFAARKERFKATTAFVAFIEKHRNVNAIPATAMPAMVKLFVAMGVKTAEDLREAVGLGRQAGTKAAERKAANIAKAAAEKAEKAAAAKAGKADDKAADDKAPVVDSSGKDIVDNAPAKGAGNVDDTPTNIAPENAALLAFNKAADALRSAGKPAAYRKWLVAMSARIAEEMKVCEEALAARKAADETAKLPAIGQALTAAANKKAAASAANADAKAGRKAAPMVRMGKKANGHANGAAA